MSVKTIYTCDKCGTEQDAPQQFWTVGVTAVISVTQDDRRPFVQGKSLQVCRPCLESFGLYVQNREKKPDLPPEPTIEDLIIDIVERCKES